LNRITLFILFWATFPVLLSAQSITLSGYIRDAANAETLIGATVSLVENANIATATNAYGYYALNMPPQSDSVTVRVSYLGYEISTKRVWGNQAQTLDFELQPEAQLLQEAVVTSNAVRDAVQQNQMGVQKISSAALKAIPVMMGETDVLKVVQLTAGVQPGSEGQGGFYVRGGGGDQNLILLDEAIVYNPDHFFGFFSTFNTDIIKNLEVYKSDFPAQYGGRLSSVLDVQMREGNMKRFEVQGGIGLIASRLTLEGPIQREKSSFVLSGRRTYFDIFTPLINNAIPEGQQIPNYYFYDLNAKMNYVLGKKDRLYASGYFGADNLAFSFGNDSNTDYKLRWGNTTGTLRWNHNFNPQLFANTSFIVSRFKYNDRFNFNDFFEFKSSSETYNISLKEDMDYYAGKNHQLKFGAHITRSIIRPIAFSAQTTTTDTLLQADAISEAQEFTGDEAAIYLTDTWQATPKLSLKGGLRYSFFLTTEGKVLSAPEPRLAMSLKLDERTALKAAYARMAQYLHQVKFNALSFINPYFPSNQNIKPQLSDQVSVGFSRLLFDDKVSITNEYYYKWMYNQLEYRNGANFLFIDKNYDTRLAVGKGWSYGGEIQIEKKDGKLTGWIAYTLSWTWRKFEGDGIDPNTRLNNGNKFPFTYDRRHVLNIVAQYQLPKNWSISANFTYRTGEALDLAIGGFALSNYTFVDNSLTIDPSIIPIYTDLNSFRMPAYHRLDIGFTKKFKPKKHFQSELAISFYNTYNRANPFFIYYDDITNEQGIVTKRVAKQVSLFPIIPAITYNFKF
jgi:hypothetical protein